MKQKEPARMTAAQARVDIWEKLRKVARPDSRFSWEFSEFITDYEGSDKCASDCDADVQRRQGYFYYTG